MGSISEQELDALLAIDDGRHFLSNIVEPLGDAFDPLAVKEYETLFARAVRRVAPELVPRLRRVTPKPLPAITDLVYVLSRITLGADIAVTSVLIDAAKRRYPHAPIVFVGPRKNYELFEADPRVEHQEAPYARSGSLRDRLAASASLWFEDGLVLDPDSRLTQLGLIRVCDDANYRFFPSRTQIGAERLPDLAALWAGGGQPYVAPLPFTGEPAAITVSLGVGENAAKRLDDEFELGLMKVLSATKASVLVDLGGSAEERARVERVLQPGMRVHDGAFAPFAAAIAKSKLYVGYDSAGGHVASACGVPVISIAKGFVNERMAARWRPLGTVIDGNGDNPLGEITTYIGRRSR